MLFGLFSLKEYVFCDELLDDRRKPEAFFLFPHLTSVYRVSGHYS